MNDPKAKEILDKVIGQITGYQNPFTVQQFLEKFAFDIRLPQQAIDSVSGEVTWASSLNAGRYIKTSKAWEINDGWLKPAIPINNIQDILQAWVPINLMATEREIESINVVESDATYFSENIYRCIDCIKSKNLLFCDGCQSCEYVVASQRSQTTTYSARVDDSQTTSESFSVSWSGNISKCMFIQDCKDMYECLFCSHITNKKFMIANMQYDEKEYYRIKEMVIAWFLNQ